MYKKKAPEKSALVAALEGNVRKADVYEALGYSREPNGNIRRKISEWYDSAGIDLDVQLNSNLLEYRICPSCGNKFSVKRYKKKVTCSNSCSNRHFRSGQNATNWKEDVDVGYRTVCFRHHEKKCVYCGEDKIVTVHHYDHNHDNNAPPNLIPLCPTHHQYVHSRYRYIVQPIIDEYIEKWKVK